MTKDKMDQHVEDNMLNEFLSDEDKPKKPLPPARPAYDYGSGGYGGYNRSFAFDDDDQPDPMDPGYTPGYKRKESSVFSRTSSHDHTPHSQQPERVAKDYGRMIAAVLREAPTTATSVILNDTDRDAIVNLLMKDLGETLDKAGLGWRTDGMKGMRMALQRLLFETMAGAKRVVPDDPDEKDDVPGYDPETGEIVPDDFPPGF